VRRTAVFLDTSALYEAADRAGRRHPETRRELERLLTENAALVTTDLVIAELHGLALGRLGPETALELVERLMASPRLSVVATGPEILADALESLRRRPGRRISLVDAASFVIMRQAGVGTAFALDSDFAAEGFITVP
jgi:predicted nucleic acid-binding protein